MTGPSGRTARFGNRQPGDRRKNGDGGPGGRTGFSLVLREGKQVIFSSRRRGLLPLLECAARRPGPAPGRVLSDRVTGIAAARVIAAGRLADRVEAGAISREAILYLEQRAIAAGGGEIIETVLRRDGTGPCPLEELSRRHPSDREFLSLLYRRFSLMLPEFVTRIPRDIPGD